jgi:prepilin-type N-terminal cleavage/methylation domain-containing protein
MTERLFFTAASSKLMFMSRILLYVRKSSGFTVIELLVVVVILGILASLSVFAFGAWR